MLCLTRPTDPSWLATALGRMDEVLIDHAHCEGKAAANARALALRASAWPAVAQRLCDLADEEHSHFVRVVAVLERRGVPLGGPPPDPYAAELRRLAHRHPAKLKGEVGTLVDRLLVAALIEARSCERFLLLRNGLREQGQDDLASFYDELLAAEAGHYRVFVDLAHAVAGEPDGAGAAGTGVVRARLAELAEAEGALTAVFGASPTVHG